MEEDDFTFAIISDLNGGERKGVFSAAVIPASVGRLEQQEVGLARRLGVPEQGVGGPPDVSRKDQGATEVAVLDRDLE